MAHCCALLIITLTSLHARCKGSVPWNRNDGGRKSSDTLGRNTIRRNDRPSPSSATTITTGNTQKAPAAPAPSQGADVDQYREGYKTDREGWAQSNTRFAPQPRIAGVPTTAGRHGGRATRLEGAPIWRTNYPTARVLAATDRVRARLVDSQSVPRGSKFPRD